VHRWWRHRTLRARLTLLAAVGLAGGLALGGLILVAVLHLVLIRSVDSSIRQTARNVSLLADSDKLATPIPSAGAPIVQVLTLQRQIVAATPSTDLLVPMLTKAEERRALTSKVVVIPGSRAGVEGEMRVIALTSFERNTDRGGTTVRVILVGASTHLVEESTETIGDFLLVAYPLLVALLTALAWLVVGWTLRPVEALRRGADMISAGGSSVGQLPVPDGDDEVHRLAVTLNDMLDRLAAGRARQRAFIADAAHELRSPITSLRTQLEVAAHVGDQPVTEDLLDDVTRLGRLVNDLLLLARADEGDPRLRSVESVDLADMVTRTVRDYANARVPVRAEVVGEVWAAGDASSLRRVLDNLVTNAVRHAAGQVVVRAVGPGAEPSEETPESAAPRSAPGGAARGAGSEPEVRDATSEPAVGGGGPATGVTRGAGPAATVARGTGPAADDAMVRVSVIDDGPGIPAEDRERVFDRFTRLDDARNRDQGGAGLGLAIVRELVRSHSGTITLADAEPGLRVDIDLPTAAPTEP